MDMNTEFDAQMAIASGTAMSTEATATIESGRTAATPIVGILFIFILYTFDFVIDRMPA